MKPLRQLLETYRIVDTDRFFRRDTECVLPTRLIVTLDVESDSDSRWGAPPVRTFRSVLEAMPERLHPLFIEFAVRPTYLLSPEVIMSEECRAVLRNLKNCELGTHLHIEEVPPESVPYNPRNPRRGSQWECVPEIERQKLRNLTQLFEQGFGFAPRSFRAGRFGVGHHTGKFLQELGYTVDSSVTPHLKWTNEQGILFPDFTDAHEMPYWVAEDGDIFRAGRSGLLEIPLTVWKLSATFLRRAQSAEWFRPWVSEVQTLVRMMRSIASSAPKRGVRRPLVMMFHSVEVVAGASPYPQTKSDVERYYECLRKVFEAAHRLGIRTCTLGEYLQEYNRANPNFLKDSATV